MKCSLSGRDAGYVRRVVCGALIVWSVTLTATTRTQTVVSLIQQERAGKTVQDWLTIIKGMYPTYTTCWGPPYECWGVAYVPSDPLGPLTVNDQLAQISTDYVRYLHSGNRPCAHNTSILQAIATDDGWAFTSGEPLADDLACGVRAPEAVVKAWVESPGHHQLLLHPLMKQIGVGVVSDWWAAVLSQDAR